MRTIALLVGLLGLIACDQQAAETPRTPPAVVVDPEAPCDLLSPAQVEEAVGVDVGGEEEVTGRDLVTRICSYETATPWTSVGLSLTDNVSPAEFDRAQRRDPANTEQVDGVGEGAFIGGCSGIVVYAEEVLVSAGVQHLTTCEETGVVLRRLGRTIVDTLHESRSISSAGAASHHFVHSSVDTGEVRRAPSSMSSTTSSPVSA